LRFIPQWPSICNCFTSLKRVDNIQSFDVNSVTQAFCDALHLCVLNLYLKLITTPQNDYGAEVTCGFSKFILIKSKYHSLTDRCISKTTQRTDLKFGVEVLLIFSPCKEFSKMLRFSGVINNYNYSPPIRVVWHGGQRGSSYLQLILFVRRRV